MKKTGQMPTHSWFPFFGATIQPTREAHNICELTGDRPIMKKALNEKARVSKQTKKLEKRVFIIFPQFIQ